MLIERRLRQDFPALRPAQFLSVRKMANDALAVNLNRDILKVTPRKIYQSVLTMNGAYCLELDRIFAGATAYADPYRKLDNFAMARRLHSTGPPGPIPCHPATSMTWSMSSPRCSASAGGMAGSRIWGDVERRRCFSVFLNPHHGRHGAVCLGHDVKRTALEIVAAEYALTVFQGVLVGLLVSVAEIAPVSAVVTVEDLEQRIFRQTFRRPGGGVDLPEGKARFHEAVGHEGR